MVNNMARLVEKSTGTGVLDPTKMVDRILPFKESSNISLFLQSLEAELNGGIGVRKEDFKQILVSKLPYKTKETILDLLGEDSTYDMLKSRLLDKVGLSKREVGNKLFVEWEKEAKSLDRVERCRRLESLVNRFVLGAKSIKEVALSLMVALFSSYGCAVSREVVVGYLCK